MHYKIVNLNQNIFQNNMGLIIGQFKELWMTSDLTDYGIVSLCVVRPAVCTTGRFVGECPVPYHLVHGALGEFHLSALTLL